MSLVVKNMPAIAGDIRIFPGLGRSPGGAHGNPLQYSSLENPMDRGAWQAMVCRVAQSQTRLKRLSACAHTHAYTLSLTHTHTLLHSLSHTHTVTHTHSHTHSHTHTTMSWFPQWDIAPRAGLGDFGASGWGVEASLPSSGADAGSGVSPELACGRVWKQRAQPQAQVFRQSVLGLMLRLVPHYKQQNRLYWCSVWSRTADTQARAAVGVFRGAVSQILGVSQVLGLENRTLSNHHRVSSSHRYLSPTLETAFVILGSSQHEWSLWTGISLLPRLVPISHGNNMTNGNNSGGAVEQEGPFYVHSAMRWENCTLL